MASTSVSSSENDQKSSVNKDNCLSNHVELFISEAEKRPNGTINIKEYFTVYLIDIKVTDENFTEVKTKLGAIWRRYTEFEQLRNYLEATYPYLILPPLPEKKVNFGWSKIGADTADPEFVERRRAGLEIFIKRIANHPIISFDNVVLRFLQVEDTWRDSVKEAGYLQVTESKLLTGIAGLRNRRTDERIEAIRDSATEVQTHLSSFLNVRAKLAEYLYVIQKLHANYGRLLSEWSGIEKSAMGDGLQQAGHFMDSLAQGIDSVLKEEETVIDMFKEYLFYCSSVQSVCRRHDALQAECLQAVKQVDARMEEKDQIEKGKISMLNRFLGSVDSDEVRESKIKSLDKKITDGRRHVDTIQQELTDFTKEALLDYDRYQKQKAKDVKNILKLYAESNVRLAKQAASAWTNIKSAIDRIP